MQTGYMRTVLLILLVITGSCGLNKERLREEGYQVSEKYSIAIKLPCQLQIDSTVVYDSTLGEYSVLVCPQIFKDTSRTSFYIDRLLASGNLVYHLNIWTNSSRTSSQALIDQQKQILQLLEVDGIEETNIDGKKALIYKIESKKVTAAWIPDEVFTYEVAVSGEPLRGEKLNEILKTIKFGPFY